MFFERIFIIIYQDYLLFNEIGMIEIKKKKKLSLSLVVFGSICETLKLIMRRSSEIEVEKLNGISYEPLKSISGSL